MDDDIQIGDFVIFNDDWAEAWKFKSEAFYNIRKGVVKRKDLRVVVLVQEGIVGLAEPHNLDRMERFIPYMTEKKYLTLIESP